MYAELCQAVEEWIAIHETDGTPLPAPTAGKDYSGKFVVRVGKDLHRELAVNALREGVQDELLAHATMLQTFGPALGRPWVDTLKGSQYPNMKELRFKAADGVWRVAFAFDPHRRGILLACGNKSGGSEKRFYRELIRNADKRFNDYLARIRKGKR